MLNSTVLGGGGYILGALGRGVEAISPFSGLDKEATRRRERLRALSYLPRRLLPNTRVYNDSWLTSAAKATLGLYNRLDKSLQQARTYALSEHPSGLANGMMVTGMLVGIYVVILLLMYNPITKTLVLNYEKIIFSFFNIKNSIKNYIRHCKNTINSTLNPPPPPPPPHEEAPRFEQNVAIRLVNLGLAAIGRKTKRTNLYLTPERETERHRAEYTFLHQLAEKYRDADTRKVLAKHFMLYKETCLYVIFSVVLKGNAELHSLIKDELTERLDEGLTIIAKTRRKQYMYAFSRAFYDEYQRTHNMERTLSYMFWSVLADKHPEIVSTYELSELMNISGLGNVYKYSYDMLKGASA